jgi:hypothetical protein
MADELIPLDTAPEEPITPDQAPSESFSQSDLFNQASSIMAEPEPTETPEIAPAQEFSSSDLLNQALALDQEPSGYQSFAENLVKLRDDPVGVSALGSILNTVRSGDLKNRYGKAYDYFLSEPGPMTAAKDLTKAVDEGDILGATKAFLSGTGSVLTNYFNLVVGRNKEEADAAALSAASTNLIGGIKDPVKASEALELGDLYSQKLEAGESIAPVGQKPEMIVKSEGREGFVTQYNTGMNLAEAEKYLKQLKSDKDKPVTESSLRVFFAKGVDALPLVTTENIFIEDDKDPDQVGRRSALIQQINNTVMEDYYLPSLSGTLTGSVAGFGGIGAGTTRILGTPMNVGGKMFMVPNRLSRIGTYSIYGGGEAAEEVRPLSWEQNLLNSFEKIAGLGLSERAGEMVEATFVTKAMGSKLAAAALSGSVPKLAPLYKNVAFVTGSTIGETISNQIDRIMAGQNPQEGFGEDVASSLGVSLGMLGVSAIGGRRASQAQVDEVMESGKKDLAEMFRDGIKKTRNDGRYTFRQRDNQLRVFRNSLDTDEAKALFDAVNIEASTDKTLLPQTAKVAQEEVDKAAGPALMAGLKAQVEKSKQATAPILPSEPLGEITGTQPAVVAEVETPEFRTQVEDFVQGALIPGLATGKDVGLEEVNIPLNPENKKALDYLEAAGRISGKESKGKGVYVLTGVRDAMGQGFGEFAKYDPLDAEREALEADLEDSEFSLDAKEQIRDEIYGKKGLTKKGLKDIQAKIGVTTDTERTKKDVEKEKLFDPATMAAAKASEKRVQKEIAEGERKVLEVPTLQLPEAELALAAAKAKQVELTALQEEMAKKGAQRKLKEIDSEVEAELAEEGLQKRRPRQVLPKTLEKEAFFNLPIAIDGSDLNKRWKSLKNKPNKFLEEDPSALPLVFGIGGELSSTELDFLKGIGAIDENNVPVMGAVEAALTRFEQLARNSLDTPQWEIIKNSGGFEKAIAASIDKFQLFLREGRSGPEVDLNDIFFSHLKDLRKKAMSRVRYKVGSVAETSIDLPGNPVQAVAGVYESDLSPAEKIAELQKVQEDVPEETKNIGLQAVTLAMADFEKSLKTKAEKALFEYIKTNPEGPANGMLGRDAKALGLTPQKFKSELARMMAAFGEAVQDKLDIVNAQYAEAEQAPAVEEIVKESKSVLTPAEIKPVFAKFSKMNQAGLFLPEEYSKVGGMVDKLQNTRNKADLNTLSGVLDRLEAIKLGLSGDEKYGDPLQTLLDQLLLNLNSAITPAGKKDPVMDKESFDFYINKIDEAKAEYINALQGKDTQAIIDGAYKYRANLLSLDQQIRGVVNRANIGKSERRKSIPVAELRTAAGKRQLAELALDKATSKRIGRITGGTEYREVESDPTKLAREVKPSGFERTERRDESFPGAAIPKAIIETAQQVGFDFGAKRSKTILKKLRSQIDGELDDVLNDLQQQTVIRTEWALENTPEHSMVLGFGPGTGKTRISLATGILYIPEGYKVIYMAPPAVLKANWKTGDIGHVIQSDANEMGISLELRGGVRRPFIDSKFDKIVVTSFEHLKELEPYVDQKTFLMIDEYHLARNTKEGKLWGPLIDRISSRLRAGRVLKMTGTPLNSMLQLGSYSRELLEGKEENSLDDLLVKYGYSFQEVRGNRAKEYRPIVQTSDIEYSPKQLKKQKEDQQRFFDKKNWDKLKAVDEQIGVDSAEANRRLGAFVNAWAQIGSLATASMSLKGVNFRAVPIKMTDELREELKSVAGSYANTTIEDAEKGEALITAQKFVLERAKVKDLAKLTVKEIKKGRKPILWVDYVKGTKAFTGGYAEATAKLLEAEIQTLMPGLKVAKLYGDDSDAKVIAASKFQNEQADYAIATIGSMGTGGQLDDKRGPKYNGKPRTNIWASLPIRADDFLQAVARAWRINTASEVDNIFALTNHGADRYAQESLLRSLKLQEAFVDSGSFGEMEQIVSEVSKVKPTRKVPQTAKQKTEKIRKAQARPAEPLFPIKTIAIEPVINPKVKAKSDAPEDVYIPSNITPEQKALVEELDKDFKRVFGKAYDKGVFTFATNKGEKLEYFFKYAFTNRAPYHDIGATNVYDEIIIDPSWVLRNYKEKFKPKQYEEGLKEIIAHERDHVTITRSVPGDRLLRYQTIGNRIISLDLDGAVTDIYSVLNDLSTKEKKLAKSSFQSKPVSLGAELTRMLLQLQYRGTITEQALGITAATRQALDKKLSNILKKLDITPKNQIAAWMDQAESVFSMWPKSAMLPSSYVKDAEEVVRKFNEIKVDELIATRIKASKPTTTQESPSNDMEAEFERNLELLGDMEAGALEEESQERKDLLKRQKELRKMIDDKRLQESKKIEAPKKVKKTQIPKSFAPFLNMSHMELLGEIGAMDFRTVDRMLGEAGVRANPSETKKGELENKQALVDQVAKYQTNSKYSSFPDGGEAPNFNRPSNIFDYNDLKIVRKLDNVLDGKDTQFLGRPVESDMYGTYITAGELYAGIKIAGINKTLTPFETTLLNEGGADAQGENNVIIYLDDLRTKVMQLAEGFASVSGDDAVPSTAIVPADEPLPEDADPTQPEPRTPPELRGAYTVAIGTLTPANTTAASPKHATSMVIFRTIANRNISYRGTTYKRGSEIDARRLINVLGDEDPTFTKFATRVPDFAGFPDAGVSEEDERYRVRAGGVNLLASIVNFIPDKAIRDRMLESFTYRQTSNEEQREVGEAYIYGPKGVGVLAATRNFLSDKIPLDLPGRAAVGFLLVPHYTRIAADGNAFAQETLNEIVQKLSVNYGTDPGRAVALWKMGPDIAAESPQVFGKMLQGQLEEATKARITPYKQDIQDTFDALTEADEIAGNAFASTPETQDVLKQIEAIRKQTAAEKIRIADLDSQIAEYINAESANDLNDIFGDITNLASLPTSADGEGDSLGLDPEMANKLSQMLLKVIRVGFDKSPEIVQKEKLRTIVLLSPFFSQAKNREEVLRVFNHHYDAAYVVAATAFRDEQKAKLEELRLTAEQKQAELEAEWSGLQPRKVTRPRGETPPVATPPKTRGEAKRRAKKLEKELDSESPVEVDGEEKAEVALADATAKALVKYAERVKNPKEKDALKEYANRLRRLLIQRTQEKGGLQPPEGTKPPVRPSAAQSLKDLLAEYPEFVKNVNDVRATLSNDYTPEELEGLEPLIEEALGRPFTISNIARVIRSLETIGGPNKSIHRLIRESKGDVAAFEQSLQTSLLEGTNISPANQAEVRKYLREGLADMIAEKRRDALEKLRIRLTQKGEKKTKKIRSAIDKLKENVQLGVLRDQEIYSLIHEKLGLPEIGPEERARIEQMVNDLSKYPKGRLLNEKVEQIYEYIKLIAPISFGDLAVSYQTANYLQGAGTLAINAVSATEGVILDGWIAGVNASLKTRFGGPEQKLQARAIRLGRQALNDTWWGKNIEGKGMARKYAMEIWKYGKFPTDSVVLKEMGGVNPFEAMLREANAGRAGKRGVNPATLIVSKPKVPAFAQPITDFLSGLIPSFIAKPVGEFVTTNENEIKVNLQAGWEPTTETGKALAKLLPTKYIAQPLLLRELPLVGKFFGKLGKVGDIPAWPYNSFLGPYILSSRLMATGDGFNKFGVKKMAEVIEAGYIVAKQNPLMPEAEFDARIHDLLNRTKDSIERATRLADIDTATFGLTPDQRLLRIDEILDQNRPVDEITKQIEQAAKTRSLRATYQDDFYGTVGLIAGSIDAFANTNWAPKAVFKFLRTSSNLVNEGLNYIPFISNLRMQYGVGRLLASSAPRYYRPPALPNTYEYDLLKGKMLTGWYLSGIIGSLVAQALHDDEENPWFFPHYKGPKDPQARKAWLQSGGKTRSIQIGKIGEPFAPLGVKLWDGPIYIAWEALPPGLTGVLMPTAIFAEEIRYGDKSSVQAIGTSLATAGLATSIGLLDLTALQGMRGIMRLISPAPGAGADSLLKEFGSTLGGIAAGFVIPYYPTFRDAESLFDGITGTPRSRMRKDGFFSSLASSFPIVAKFGEPDLDHLGGRISSQIVNNMPLVRRFVSTGVSTDAYDTSDAPTDQAVHDKLITIFAKHGRVITWNAGDLKAIAQQELMVQAARGIPIDKSPYEILALSRDLTFEEKYDWVKTAGPAIQAELEKYIPAFEQAQDNAEFDYILSKTKVNAIKRAALQYVLRKEGLEKVMIP